MKRSSQTSSTSSILVSTQFQPLRSSARFSFTLLHLSLATSCLSPQMTSCCSRPRKNNSRFQTSRSKPVSSFQPTSSGLKTLCWSSETQTVPLLSLWVRQSDFPLTSPFGNLGGLLSTVYGNFVTYSSRDTGESMAEYLPFYNASHVIVDENEIVADNALCEHLSQLDSSVKITVLGSETKEKREVAGRQAVVINSNLF